MADGVERRGRTGMRGEEPMPGTGMSVTRFTAFFIWFLLVKYVFDLGAAALNARMPNVFTSAIKAVVHA
jgi:hypothetical protein